MTELEIIQNAFPIEIQSEVNSLLTKITVETKISHKWGIINKSHLISFVRQNPDFYSRTRSRIYSYWDCDFRRQFPEILKGVRMPENQRYVGFRLLNKIDKLINDK